ncbi:ParA family protein [Leptolyngbya sp. FACHB-711]|uniref:ParA family protein n=1 Tax=unclassified Leptolyngbya TaxID=2650499 RepID=UPI001682F0E9|nr:ParA family protein [Leptolyngbya sp. FACHB-711]MBD2024609.1 ParA family protein [Leptolyngbya sp. FACHB-711]
MATSSLPATNSGRQQGSIQINRQIVLWIVANAGGIGKTTLAVNLGYLLALRGARVLLVDLDTNGSAARFCGQNPIQPPDKTTAVLFDKDFNGSYPILTPDWGTPHSRGRFDICPGGDAMISLSVELALRPAKEYVLKKAFKKYPPDYDLIILDSPASMDLMSYCAMAVATHIFLPLPMSVKAAGLDSLLIWLRDAEQSLDLEPAPKILGGVPMKVATNADQKYYASTIAPVLEQQGIPCFTGVRESKEFENAANRGVAPLIRYRPGHAANGDFAPIVSTLIQEFAGE